MKKLTLLVTVIFTVFMFVGNASAASIPDVPDGYTLLTPDNGLYSSENIDFSSFKWLKGDAAYSHQLTTVNNNDGNFYLQLQVTTVGNNPSTYIFKSNPDTIQFQTYKNQITGGYFWLMEDMAVAKSDQDYNDLWARIDTNITPTPVPAAVWLFGSGLVGLAAFRRRK
ncbi:MAG: VPLPA-CTERM sorting domain-containing protein, partial [Desulfamplus sp.]|nr:VPLPA-CTERM sorting domain-containing protein [Desulfamplus sp.]